MINLSSQFSQGQSIFFVCTEIKKALGLEDVLPDFHIVTAKFDPIIKHFRKNGVKIFCLEEHSKLPEHIFNSGKILEHEKVLSYIRKNSIKQIPAIAFFKPSLKTDFLIGKYQFKKIGNPASLNEQFENKIKFAELLNRDFSEYIIPFKIGTLKNLDFSDLAKDLSLPFVVQFGHGWAGKTTFFISNENSFIKLKSKFPSTLVKCSRQIAGFTVLNNCTVFQKSVLVSPPALQINGIKKLASSSQVTCGRQWPANLLDEKMKFAIKTVSRRVGRLMQGLHYKGFFGLDFIVSRSSGQFFISEINARLTASSPFYTRLERGVGIVPLLAYHYAAFLDIELPKPGSSELPIYGSQLIIRNKETAAKIKLKKTGVYEMIGQNIVFQKEDYKIESVKDNQFIFYRRNSEAEDSEIVCLETKKPVLQSPHELAPWTNNIIS